MDYWDYLDGKYSKHHAKVMFSTSLRYYSYYLNPSLLAGVKGSLRKRVLCALASLAKYSGTYEEYKLKLKMYGIKWLNSDTAFNGFMSILNHRHDTLPDYLQKIQMHLKTNEQLFVKFLIATGLRISEAETAFNKIIECCRDGKIYEYYDETKQLLMHWKYREQFLRQTKNCFISFADRDLISEICQSSPVVYNAVHCRLQRHKLKLRLHEFRSYNNTWMRKHGLLSEAVDILAGRVPKSVFVRHYLGISISELQQQVIPLQQKLLDELYGNMTILENTNQASNYCT
jgi:hypothetical protein